MLHTWGQNLLFHPHLHCVVTGGGLSRDGQHWVAGREDYFLPVRVLGQLFRGKFLAGLKAAYQLAQCRRLLGGGGAADADVATATETDSTAVAPAAADGECLRCPNCRAPLRRRELPPAYLNLARTALPFQFVAILDTS